MWLSRQPNLPPSSERRRPLLHTSRRRRRHEGRRGDRVHPRVRGRRHAHRVPGQPAHRARGGGGHPADHRPPGADRAPHGRFDEPDDVREADRRVHDADGAGLRERVRWRGPGVRRFRADPGARGRPRPPRDDDAAQLQRLPELPQRHEVDRPAGPARDGRADDAAGLRPTPERPAAAGPRRGPVGRLGRGVPRSVGLRAADHRPVRAGPRGRGTRRRGPRRRRAADPLRRPGRPLRRGLDRAASAGRAPRRTRHHQPPGQERLPRGPSALARLGRADGAAAGRRVHGRGGPGLRHRRELHQDRLRAPVARREALHPRDGRPGRSRPDRAGGGRAGRRRPPHPGRASRGGRRPDPRAAHGARRDRRRADRQHPERSGWPTGPRRPIPTRSR